jgi:hypothetical protein
VDAALRRLVFQRACGQCEYCTMPSNWDPLPFCVDHIIAQQHAGPTIESNLALSCFSCNTHKGPNIAGLDPDNGRLTRLFHPRTDSWSTAQHFSSCDAQREACAAFIASIARLTGSTGVPRPATRTMPTSRINLQHKSLLLRE